MKVGHPRNKLGLPRRRQLNLHAGEFFGLPFEPIDNWSKQSPQDDRQARYQAQSLTPWALQGRFSISHSHSTRVLAFPRRLERWLLLLLLPHPGHPGDRFHGVPVNDQSCHLAAQNCNISVQFHALFVQCLKNNRAVLGWDIPHVVRHNDGGSIPTQNNGVNPAVNAHQTMNARATHDQFRPFSQNTCVLLCCDMPHPLPRTPIHPEN